MHLTPDIIDAAMEAGQDPQPANNLTASRWKSCDRAMWLTLRNASPVGVHPGRLLRTFKIGHVLEISIIDWLKETGAKVSHQQARLVNQWGHTLALIDGVIHKDSEVYLLEIKTQNNKAFKAWEKNGAPDYYRAQVQLEMHHSSQLSAKGTQLTKCLFAVLNKDTSELLIDVVDYDPAFAQLQTERVYNVIESEALPQPTVDYKCAFCDHAEVCQGKRVAEITCRTCAHVSVIDGAFTCQFGTDVCRRHVLHPQLVELLGFPLVEVDHETVALKFEKFAIAPEGTKLPGMPTFTSKQFAMAHANGLTNDPQFIDLMAKTNSTLASVNGVEIF